MSEYTEVELPFLQQLAAQGWTVVDQGCAAIPQDPATSLRTSFREWLLPGVFDAAVRRINTLPNGKPWLTDRQLGDLRGQLTRQPNRTLLEANEAKLTQSTGIYESVSGVNLEEEAANLIRFQQSYAASAQIVNTAKTIFDTLLSSVR